MDIGAEVKKAIREITGIEPSYPVVATVVSLETATCTVTLSSGLELSEVRLTATNQDSEDYYRIVPKQGSEVLLISQTGELSSLFVVQVNQVERIEYKQNGLEFVLDSSDGKLMLKNQTTSLYEIMSAFTELLKGFQVYTPSGVSGTPITTTLNKIVQVENKFKTLLK